MVFHWWNAYHYGHLEYFLRLQAVMGCILLVYWYNWYDWYQWNIIYSNGISLVKCMSLRGLRIFSSASGLEVVHSTCPLVRLVRLVPMEYHSFGSHTLATENIQLYFACVWVRALWERKIYFVFSLRFCSHSLVQERRICIVFSMCFNSHALRTKNIHCIKRVFGLALCKNEEYTLYLTCVCARTL